MRSFDPILFGSDWMNPPFGLRTPQTSMNHSPAAPGGCPRIRSLRRGAASLHWLFALAGVVALLAVPSLCHAQAADTEISRFIQTHCAKCHNDVDKEGYPAVLAAVPPRLKRGGIFVTDNTLWHERVLNPREASDRAVLEFDRKLYDSAQFFTTLLPIRDGITVSVKL